MSSTVNAKVANSPSKPEQSRSVESKNNVAKTSEEIKTADKSTGHQKMAKKLQVSGYKEFREAVEKIEKEVQLNIYFTGTKDEDGVSWCPDCVLAEPMVNKALEEFADKDSVFLVVYVGERTFWKDMQNPFRKDTDAPVSVIPTLIRWKSPVRLDGDQCSKENLLEMFFTEDAD